MVSVQSTITAHPLPPKETCHTPAENFLCLCSAGAECAGLGQRFNHKVNNLLHLHLHLHLSCSLADRWGSTGDFTTDFLHFPRFSAFRRMMLFSRPVPYLMLSCHRFLCLPLRLPPCTVPCKTVLASPDGRVTCLYHFSLCLLPEVRNSHDNVYTIQGLSSPSDTKEQNSSAVKTDTVGFIQSLIIY